MSSLRKSLQMVSTCFSGLLPALFLSLLAAPSIRAQDSPSRPTDPFADPAHDVFNPLRYIPSNILTAIAMGSFIVLALVFLPFTQFLTVLVLITAVSQTWMMRKFGGKFMLTLLISEYSTWSVGSVVPSLTSLHSLYLGICTPIRPTLQPREFRSIHHRELLYCSFSMWVHRRQLRPPRPYLPVAVVRPVPARVPQEDHPGFRPVRCVHLLYSGA